MTTVSVLQFAATNDKAANRETIARLTARAAGAGASLVLAPEMSMFTDWKSDDFSAEHEDLDGPFGSFVDDLAKEHGVTLVAGMTERVPDSKRGYNTVIASGPDGTRLGRYRKVHLYDAFNYKESEHVIGGDFEPLVVDVDGVPFGVMTCYDLRFPEIARALVDAGAQALLVPSAWAVGPLKEDHWTTLVRARAIENTAYVVAANQVGRACTGLSMVVDPMGVVIANAGESEGVASATVEVTRVDEAREKNPCLANRRFEVRAR